MAEQYSCVCVKDTFFIHSCLYRHLDCFLILAIVNKAAMNIGEHVCFQISVFAIFELVFLLFPDIPRSRVSGVYSSSIFSFWELSICFPQWLHQFRFPPSVCTSVLFSPHPRQHGFLMIIILTDVRWYLWFWFAFTWWLAMLSIFSCVYWPSAFPLWKNAFSVLLPVFHSVLCFLDTEVYELLIYVGY